jgi:hypothetical protein
MIRKGRKSSLSTVILDGKNKGVTKDWIVSGQRGVIWGKHERVELTTRIGLLAIWSPTDKYYALIIKSLGTSFPHLQTETEEERRCSEV